ncbi:MAG: hypothetical protein IJC01_01590 [Clostridia bacterium]|nr:hypothetical protein [Clostridia bacterium]
MENTEKKGTKMPEFIRKFLVTLKRNPQVIPMAVLLVAFIIYSFNLTYVSKTTAAINKANMGLYEFVVMLLSILSFVCLLNAFPKRAKPKIAMIVLAVLMIGAVILSNVMYQDLIKKGIEASPRLVEEGAKFRKEILGAQSMLTVHLIVEIAGLVIFALLPVYAPLLKKINTSIQLDYSEEMGEIDLEEEE